MQSKWGAQLAAEQLDHGGGARVHLMDSRARAKEPTTESAVERAVQLGLAAADDVLARARDCLVDLLQITIPWPADEFEEPNDRWATGKEMSIAATLALIEPDHEALSPIVDTWVAIAETTFAEGGYDLEAEWCAHCQLTGATTMRGSYLVIRNRYALTLLGVAEDRLSDHVDAALVDWIWQHPEGNSNVGTPVSRRMSAIAAAGGLAASRWLASHRLLSRYRSGRVRAEPLLLDVWSMRGDDGLWDLGRGSARCVSRRAGAGPRKPY